MAYRVTFLYTETKGPRKGMSLGGERSFAAKSDAWGFVLTLGDHNAANPAHPLHDVTVYVDRKRKWAWTSRTGEPCPCR